MPSPSDIKRKRQKLRNEFYGHPWNMDTSALSTLGNAIEDGDIESIQAALSFGGDGIDTTMRVVNGVAVIPVAGVLRDAVDYMVKFGGATSYQLLERDFQSALANDQIKSIIFYCNSPGGSAIGCKRVADSIFSARGKKPIVAYVQGQCCSACYYIGAACDRIEATADSMVGSIGTIMPHMEMAGYIEAEGYGVTVITNGDSPKKGHGNQYEKLTPEGKATLQSFIDSYGKPFIADVARYRATSVETVIANFGQGDAIRADVAVGANLIDSVVTDFNQTLSRLTGSAQQNPIAAIQSQIVLPVAALSASTSITEPEAVATGTFFERVKNMKISAKVRAQMFAIGLITAMEASDEACVAALNGWFRGATPADESAIIKGLQASAEPAKVEAVVPPVTAPAANVAAAHSAEQSEARLGELKAAADIINGVTGKTSVTDAMVIEACTEKLNATAAMKKWNTAISGTEAAVPNQRVEVGGSQPIDKFAADAIEALAYRAMGPSAGKLSDSARNLANRPLWAIAGEALQLAGVKVDMYGDRELLCDEAMQMGNSTKRVQFFSSTEDSRYISASVPFSRPGDFPNILSGLANKYLDMIELDDDYSYGKISAVLPGGLNDFKPAMMINKGIMEEMDELSDGEKLKDLGLSEEVLSYIFLRRFGNRFGWTPVMLANDDLGAFAEGMLGLAEAWEVTQNRMVLDRITGTETLLDGSALFANRADTGTGTIPAANDNLISSGGAVPSDTTWAAMCAKYSEIGGINTGRRVRGVLNKILVPTNAVYQSAVRTFEAGLLETKTPATDATVGIYRGKVEIIPESELNSINATAYYGLRNPTRLNTATVVRAYFNGFGTAGRRERWYDPETKTTYVSLEGRIAVATKNWRYAVKNPGT